MADGRVRQENYCSSFEAIEYGQFDVIYAIFISFVSEVLSVVKTMYMKTESLDYKQAFERAIQGKFNDDLKVDERFPLFVLRIRVLSDV